MEPTQSTPELQSATPQTSPAVPLASEAFQSMTPPPAPLTLVQPVPAQIQPQQFGASQRIVIVEDNTSLAEIYKIRLELLGYKCFVAYDGREALRLIEQELPDLVLLDLMVPKIAGDQILEIMRASDWGKDIKVQIISNLNEVDAPVGLREQGIEGYAVKANLSNDQLDLLVDNILKPADQKEDIVLG